MNKKSLNAFHVIDTSTFYFMTKKQDTTRIQLHVRLYDLQHNQTKKFKKLKMQKMKHI